MVQAEKGSGRKTVGAVLVIGGGIGGMQAALDLADSGFCTWQRRSLLSAESWRSLTRHFRQMTVPCV